MIKGKKEKNKKDKNKYHIQKRALQSWLFFIPDSTFSRLLSAKIRTGTLASSKAHSTSLTQQTSSPPDSKGTFIFVVSLFLNHH